LGVLALTAAALTACATCGLDSKLGLIKNGMKTDQVVALLGNPTSIEETQTDDQTVSAQVYHYSCPTGDGAIVFVNGAVFSTTLLAGAKS
jgi:hypothetical protein